jgi:hypothetical protein
MGAKKAGRGLCPNLKEGLKYFAGIFVIRVDGGWAEGGSMHGGKISCILVPAATNLLNPERLYFNVFLLEKLPATLTMLGV